MMDKDFLVLWVSVATIIVAITAGVTVYNKHELDVIGEMVKNGASPMEARCSVANTNTVCALLAAQRGE